MGMAARCESVSDPCVEVVGVSSVSRECHLVIRAFNDDQTRVLYWIFEDIFLDFVVILIKYQLHFY